MKQVWNTQHRAIISTIYGPLVRAGQQQRDVKKNKQTKLIVPMRWWSSGCWGQSIEIIWVQSWTPLVFLQFYFVASFVIFHRLYLSSGAYMQSVILVTCPGDETSLFHWSQHSRCSHYLHLKMKAELAFETLCVFNTGRWTYSKNRSVWINTTLSEPFRMKLLHL
jgi:hypothetical protein